MQLQNFTLCTENHIHLTFEFLHIKLSINSLNLSTRWLQSKGIDPRISSVEDHIKLWSQVWFRRLWVQIQECFVVWKENPSLMSLILNTKSAQNGVVFEDDCYHTRLHSFMWPSTEQILGSIPFGRSLNHNYNEPTVRGRHRKVFSSIQSCLADSSWIHLILLNKLI